MIVSAPFEPNPLDAALRAGVVGAADLMPLAVNLRELVACDVAATSHMAGRHVDGETGRFYAAMAVGEAEGLRLLEPFAAAVREAAGPGADAALDALALAYPSCVARIALRGGPAEFVVCYLHLWEPSTRTYRELAQTLSEVAGFDDDALAHFVALGRPEPELTALAERIVAEAAPAEVRRGLQLAQHLHVFEALFWRRMAEACTPAEVTTS